MEDSYPSLNSGESMDMEWEVEEKADPQDQKEEVVIMQSRWPEQEQHLVTCFAKHLENTMRDMIKKDCYGCQIDHPSQIQHDKCMMMSQEEKLDNYLNEAWSLISEEAVLHQWYKDLRDHSSPPLFAREIDHIEALLARSKETKQTHSYLTDLFKQKVWIELMTYHHL
jgi:hypothetical protein